MRRTLRRRSTPDTPGGPATDDLLRAVTEISDVLDVWRTGDLEVRVPPLPGPPQVQALRTGLNHFVDVTDAYVRETSASLTAVQEGRHHRQFLVRGMPGVFRDGARTINTARRAMVETARRADSERARTRAELADAVSDVSANVAAASTELGASAEHLAQATHVAVGGAVDALDVVRSLERSSQEIQQAVRLIKDVAAQTRLLALNATIEAARAGEAGRGFAVVADEVKNLAQEAATSSDDITRQVEAVQEATAAAVGAIERISGVMHEMQGQVLAIAAAAGGSGEAVGLAQMAETLRAEISRFTSA